MAINIKLKIGEYPQEHGEGENITSLLFSLKESDVANTASKIKNIVTSTSASLPHIVVKLPKSLQETLTNNSPLQLFFEKLKINTKKEVIGNQVYLIGSYNQDIVKFIVKLQYVFKDIAKLNNWISLKISENKEKGIDKEEKREKRQRRYLSDVIVSVQGEIDKQSINTIKKSLKQVSPNFLNSPLIAILQLFGEMACQLEFDSFEFIPQQLKQTLPKPTKQTSGVLQFTQKLQSSSQSLELHFCIPNLFSISGTVTPSFLASFLLNN